MDRRRLLGLTATTAVMLGLPVRLFAQSPAPGPVMRRSAPIWRGRNAPAAGETVEQAKHHLLDTLAAMMSGSELAPGQAAQRYVRDYAGKGVGDDRRHDVDGDAGRCGARQRRDGACRRDRRLAHASHSHPGCAVVPAALAAGEQFGVDGARFLRAVALGYDIGPRVVMAWAAPRSAMRAAWHAQHRRNVRRCRGRRLRRRPRCAADALAARLRRAAVIRHRRLAARHRSHREGVRFRRHAGAQRRHGGAGGAIRLDRRR